MATNIIGCSCKHEFQDKTYGKGFRLGNQRKDGFYKCTSCGRTTGGSDKASKKLNIASLPTVEELLKRVKPNE
jgi:hypothetical protein